MSLTLGAAQDGLPGALAMFDAYAGAACDGQVYDLREAPGPLEPGEHVLFAPGLAFN
jgi:hypothetical protein